MLEISHIKLFLMAVAAGVVFYSLILPMFSISKGRNPNSNNLEADLIDMADAAVEVAEIAEVDLDLL